MIDETDIETPKAGAESRQRLRPTRSSRPGAPTPPSDRPATPELHAVHMAARPLAVSGSAAAGLVVAVAYQPVAGTHAILIWAAVLGGALVLRFSLVAAVRHLQRQMPVSLLMTLHRLLAGTHGLAWGAAAWIVGSHVPNDWHLLLSVILAGVATAGAAVVALDAAAAAAFVLATLLPAIALGLLHGGPLRHVEGLLLSVLALFLLWNARLTRLEAARGLELRRQLDRRSQQLEGNEAVLERTGSLAKVGGWELDLRTSELTVTRQARRIHGFGADDALTRQAVAEFIEPADRELLVAAMRSAAHDGRRFDVEVRATHVDGSRIWVRVMGEPVAEGGVVSRILGATQDVTARKAAESETLELRERLVAVVEQVAEAVLLVDQHGRIAFANGSAGLLFGWPAEALEGQAVQALLPDLLASHHDADTLAGTTHRTRARTGVAAVIDADVTVTPVRWRGTASHVFVARDATASQRVQRRLEEAAHEALKASRAKSMLLASASHEIRTPLNGMVGMVELLSGTHLDAEQQRYVLTLRRSVKTLIGLLSDVLEMARIEAGELKVTRVTFRPRKAVRECADLMAPAASRKGLAFTVDVDEQIPLGVSGDRQRLLQVLNNLVSNAIKYTAQGRVHLEVKPAPDQPDGWIRFAVVDTGPGIDMEHADLIFEPFARLADDDGGQDGSAGLGLAISRMLVRAMGGELSLASRTGGGSEFSFGIPLPAVERDPNAGAESIDVVDSAFAPIGLAEPAPMRRALVADDNEVNQIYAQSALDRLGWQVDVVGNGQGAVQACAANRYDIVLMDCQMPGIDGLQATRMIRRHERDAGKPRCPIVALTATASAEDIDRALEAGMDDVVCKPYELRELARVINKACPTP